MFKILIIDNSDVCHTLARFLHKNDYNTEIASTGEDGLRILRKNHIDLIICDYCLPDCTGLELLQKIKILAPKAAVIITTASPNVKTAVEIFKLGAADYITKPLFPDELLITIAGILKNNNGQDYSIIGSQSLVNGYSYSKPEALSTSSFIVGKSSQSQAVQRSIELIAPSDLSVIIQGDTGTGKEFAAQSIHRFSKRCNRPFIPIDCGALPKELAGSELFGHMKGSFTGAIADKQGSFEAANGGTIFLDEVGNLSYENQIKLLRVIQERKIKRIGATRDTCIDVRIISATNEDLSKAVKDGRIREDLYHRLNEFKIYLSPIRERKEDIMVYAEHFLQKANTSLNKNVKNFDTTVIEQLKNYFWYGNLRELANVVRRSVLLTTGETILSTSLPPEITQATIPSPPEEVIGILKSIASSAERQAIIDMLAKVAHNKSKAAVLLNIDRKTLYNKLKLYNILI